MRIGTGYQLGGDGGARTDRASWKLITGSLGRERRIDSRWRFRAVQTNPGKRDCHRLPQPEKSRKPNGRPTSGPPALSSSVISPKNQSKLKFPPACRLWLLSCTASIDHLPSSLHWTDRCSFLSVLPSHRRPLFSVALHPRPLIYSPCRRPVLVFASSRTPELLSATHMALSVGLVVRGFASRAPMLRPLSNRALSSVYGIARSV